VSHIWCITGHLLWLVRGAGPHSGAPGLQPKHCKLVRDLLTKCNTLSAASLSRFSLPPPPLVPPFPPPPHVALGALVWLVARVGFASTLGCVVGGIVCGRLGDIMSRFKGILLFLFLLSTLTFVWFSLITNKTIKPSEWQLYLSVTFGR
jgi:hypothetical protein